MDSTVRVPVGTSQFIYLDNHLVNNTSASDVTVKWKILSRTSNIAGLEGGICTISCYPPTKTEGIETISQRDGQLIFKGDFTFTATDTGSATMVVAVFDTTDSANTYVEVTYHLRVLIDTTTAVEEIPARSSCLRADRHSHAVQIMNQCAAPTRVVAIDMAGRILLIQRLDGHQTLDLPVALPSVRVAELQSDGRLQPVAIGRQNR